MSDGARSPWTQPQPRLYRTSQRQSKALRPRVRLNVDKAISGFAVDLLKYTRAEVRIASVNDQPSESRPNSRLLTVLEGEIMYIESRRPLLSCRSADMTPRRQASSYGAEIAESGMPEIQRSCISIADYSVRTVLLMVINRSLKVTKLHEITDQRGLNSSLLSTLHQQTRSPTRHRCKTTTSPADDVPSAAVKMLST